MRRRCGVKTFKCDLSVQARGAISVHALRARTRYLLLACPIRTLRVLKWIAAIDL